MANLYKNEEITKSRLNVFLGWEHFNTKGNVAPGRMDQNLCGRLWTQHDRSCITLSVANPGKPLENPNSKALDGLVFQPAAIGDSFGPAFSSRVFRLDILIPDKFDNLPVHLIWDSNSEALVLSEEGVPLQGLVGGDHWARRADFPLFTDHPGTDGDRGKALRLYIEIACNGLFGAGRGGDIEPPDMSRTYSLSECCLAIFNPAAWDLIHDVTLMKGLAEHIPNTPRRLRALHIANDVVNVVDVADPETYSKGRQIASKFLLAQNGSDQSRVVAMLHSHIDLAWLWPMASTPGKGSRTFATVLRLMDQYPECVFVQSQAQLFDWVKKQHPSLFHALCKRVEEGRFIPVGGTWVEMDCNIPSGEALVRQFIHGQRFFEDHFSIRCKEFWLPDTFGYAAQLPQIMKECGIDYFMTQKLSWNLFNKFPHSSFIWEGLDGSRVLAHMPPADTYNSQAFPEEIIRSAHKNKDASIFDQSILLVGHGDGGGGPSPAMLESLNRMRDIDGVPKVEFGTPKQFFDELQEKEALLPRWVGELYFELHRGTYTSQAAVKWANRQCEFSLRSAEMCCALASLSSGSFQYPAGELDTSWKLVLKNAFHDTLPGSCIGLVYEETAADYAHVLKTCADMEMQAFDILSEMTSTLETNGVKKMKAENGDAHLVGVEASVVSSLMRSTGPLVPAKDKLRIIEIFEDGSDETARIEFAQLQCVDRTRKNKCTKLVAMKESIGGFGVSSFPSIEKISEIGDSTHILRRESGGSANYLLLNNLVEATISDNGRVSSLVLKDGDCRRELLSKKTDINDTGGNRLVLYDDVPMFWCAWDTEVYAFEKKVDIGEAVESKIVEKGPLRCTLYLKYPLTKHGSLIEQYISIRSGSARIDFVTHVNWKESRKLLRVVFDTEIRSAFANYHSQFGIVQRGTTFNHSWDVAKFEAVGHQFCDLSEHKFGMALMSDCKYGYSVRDQTMRLSLLRASKSPDDKADMGQHAFTYSVFPHWGGFPNTDIVTEAHDLNEPTISRTWEWTNAGLSAGTSLQDMRFRLENKESRTELGLVGVSCFKRAERHKDGFVLRLFEAFGCKGSARIRVPDGLKVSRAVLCNMLEDVSEANSEVPISENGAVLDVDFKPFQVQTIFLQLCISKE